MNQNNPYLLLIGANSDIGFAIAEKFYNHGFNLILAARDVTHVKTRAEGLDQKRISFIVLDTHEYGSILSAFNSLTRIPDVIVNAIGYLGDQALAQSNWEEAYKILSINLTDQIAILNTASEILIRQKKGCIICISSMAGERGRQSNFIYGAAKAGLSAYLSGLRQYAYKFGVHVITVIPGFVNTKMTSHLQLPKRLTITPERLANRVFSAYLSKRNVIYSSFSWWLISLIIRNIPEFIYKKLKL